MLVIQILKWVLLGVEIVVALPILYLCIVATSAMLGARRRKKLAMAFPDASARFAILVPAHNETAVLNKLLTSLAALDYPTDSYTVCVVADNCTDGTADLARSSGLARVYERFDEENRGKGFALRWLLQQLEQEQQVFDAYVVLDADSVVDSAFLKVMSYGLAQGARALQAHNTVLNVMDSPSTALRWLALSLMNYVRPLGRNGLGCSSTLTGNGMCLSHAILKSYPWQSFALAEDYYYYLTLVQHGEKVLYMPEALVRSEMPLTFEQMRTQDIRWEASQGAPSTWKTVWKLLKAGLRYRDRIRLEAIAELLSPPLSNMIGLSLIVFVASVILWSLSNVIVALLLIGGVGYYISSAFFLLHPPRTIFRAFLSAPRFVLWKLWIVLVLKRGKKSQTEWVRTSRNAS